MKYMTHLVTIGLLGTCLSLPPMSLAAPDAETQRLEAAALCHAMPYRCDKGTFEARVEGAPLPPRPAKVSPPVTPPPAPSPAPGVRADGWPEPRNTAQLLATECAVAAGIDPQGTINPQQLRLLTTCIDVILRAVRP